MNLCNGPEGQLQALQMNSALEHAHLELVSAHCAIHQLRLRYSSDDLARFGRRDLLRKSADAASAIHHFYSAIDDRLTEENHGVTLSQPTSQQISEAIQWLADYLLEQRDRYQAVSLPLGKEAKAQMWPYFSSALLDRIRIIELRGSRMPVPGFLAKVRALGFDPPEISHMDSVTFIDIVAFNQKLSDRSLFHALVHAVQMEVLGLQRYTELWVHGFIKTRVHFTVPLEVHAFSLASRFLRPAIQRLSVEDHVRRWAEENRY